MLFQETFWLHENRMVWKKRVLICWPRNLPSPQMLNNVNLTLSLY